MRGSTWLSLFLPVLLACQSAHGQIYVCKDDAGRTITSDRLAPECANSPVREYDKSGNARRAIPAPLTAEQKRQIQLQEERHKAEQAAAEEQRRNDYALRLRYRSEADIEAARQRMIGIVQEQRKREALGLSTAEQQWQAAQADAQPYRKRNAALPAPLQRRMEDAERAKREAKKSLDERDAEIEQINAKFDDTLRRYREITGVTAAK